jgi:hypothetical protein
MFDCLVRIAPSSVPGYRNRQVLAEATAEDHGSRNAAQILKSSAAGGF